MSTRHVIGAVVVAALCVWQAIAIQWWGAERVQANMAVLTALSALWFIALYAREPWWRAWFGRSLMLLAVAVLMYTLSVILFRNFGDYPGRDALLVISQDATLAAIVMRTLVLRDAQKHDRRHEHDLSPRPPSDPTEEN